MKRIVFKSALGFRLIVLALAWLSVAEAGQLSPESSASAKAKFLGGPITPFTAKGTIPFLSTSSGSCDTFACAASQGHCSCSRWGGTSGTDLPKLGRSKVPTDIKITTNEDDCTVIPGGSCCSIDGAVKFQRNADIANLIFVGESCAGVIAGSYQMLPGTGEFSTTFGVGDINATLKFKRRKLGILHHWDRTVLLAVNSPFSNPAIVSGHKNSHRDHQYPVLRCARRRKAPDSCSRSDVAGEDRFQLVRRDDFELRVGAIARLLVGAPSPELRHMAEAGALHVLVCDFDYQFGSERLPR